VTIELVLQQFLFNKVLLCCFVHWKLKFLMISSFYCSALDLKRFKNISCLLGLIHTQYFCTQFWDKKTLFYLCLIITHLCKIIIYLLNSNRKAFVTFRGGQSTVRGGLLAWPAKEIYIIVNLKLTKDQKKLKRPADQKISPRGHPW